MKWKDIRLWILFFFLLRLIGITHPPLEVGHNWRQTTVTMVARNFLEVNNNPFYPRVDMAGDLSGITGMEFPLLNYSIYLLSEVLGYQHWYGRAINLLISSLGLWYFFRLVRKYFTHDLAFYATLVLTVSVWFQFSRKVMPDTFSMSLILAGIYYGTNYLEASVHQRKWPPLVAYAGLLLLGVLSKLPSGYLLVVLGGFVFQTTIPLQRKLVFALVSFLALLPALGWYYYWVPHLVETFGFWHFFMGKSIGQGAQELVEHWPQVLRRFYGTALHLVGFVVFLAGLGTALWRKEWKVIVVLALSLFSFSLVVLKAGFTFAHHNYYIVPFVPVMALVAGYGLSQIKQAKVVWAVLLIIAVEGLANQASDFRIKDKNLAMVQLENDLDLVSERQDRILINSGKYPTPLYFAHRKGWINTNAAIGDAAYLETLRAKGLKYIVILKRTFGQPMELSGHRKVLENENYCIYQL
ncbi:MAG: ArnT family glycosyltransferase [Salibacteraceae bacterium]